MSPAVETETTLLPTGPNPGGFFARLAALTEVAGLSLHARGTRRLVDRYLDTPEGKLREKGIALRLRSVGDDPPRGLVTVKGPARLHADGRMERSELELPWSAEALEPVLGSLRELGAELPSPRLSSLTGRNTAELLDALGLRTAQERSNERRVLELREEKGGEAPRLRAEMDLDAVTFRLPSRDVRHFEIEIEARGEGGIAASRAVSTALLAGHGTELVLWPYSKTATGEILARLDEEGALAALLDEEGRPTVQAYRKLRRLLR